MKLTYRVNGRTVEADGVWPGASLLTVLRDHMDMPGSKNACEQTGPAHASLGRQPHTLGAVCLMRVGLVRTHAGLRTALVVSDEAGEDHAVISAIRRKRG